MVRVSDKQQLASIVIVNHNGKKWLKNCLDSIAKQTYRYFEVIIVDNLSTDDSVGFIEKYYPKVKTVISKTNIGFGRANNLGVETSRGEEIFFLNNDTVFGKDLLEKLLFCKKQKNLNILGPKILDYSGKEVYQSDKLSIDITGYIGNGRDSLYVDGCALMISKKDFMQLGGFDESYFMYSEEIDLCWRAHLYGMKVGICNGSAVKHFGGGTGGYTQYERNVKRVIPLMRKYEVEKNNLRNVLKNYKLINLCWILPVFIIQSLCESILYTLTGNVSASQLIWKAYLWNLKNIRDTFSQRKIVQKKRIVGDMQIISMMSTGLNKFSALKTIGIPKFK